MQSRRDEGMMTHSPAEKLQNQRFELDSDPYMISSRDEEQSQRFQRNLSPSRLDGLQRIASRDGRRTQVQRRDYGWRLDGGKGGRVRSSSPPYGQVRERAQFHERFMHGKRSSPTLEMRRRFELSDSGDLKSDVNPHSSLKHVHGHDQTNSRTTMNKNFDGNRVSASDGHGMLVQKSVAVEDGTVRGMFRLPQQLAPTSNYKETGEDLSSVPVNFGVSRFENDRLRSRNTNELSGTESFRGERSIFYPGDGSYPVVPASQFKDFASTSSGISRCDVPGKNRNAQPLSSDEFNRNSGKSSEALGFNGYGQRPPDSSRGSDADPRSLAYYQHDPAKFERQDYLYSTVEERESDIFGYPSDEIYRKMPPHARVGFDHGMPPHAQVGFDHGDMPSHEQVDYDHIDMPPHSRVDYDHRDMPPHARLDYDRRDMPPHARLDYDHRGMPPHARLDYDRRDMPPHARIDHHHKDSLRPGFLDFAVDSIDDAEGSHRNHKKGSLSDYSILQEHSISNYPDMSRKSYPSKHGGNYLDSGNTHVEFVSKSQSSVSRDHGISHLRAGYGFGRDAGPRAQKDRQKDSSAFEYDDVNMHRLAGWQRVEAEELGIYDSSGRILKRKYSVDEDGCNSRGFISSRSNFPSGTHDLNDGVEEWIEEDMSGLYSPKSVRFYHHKYKKAGRKFDERGHHRDVSYENWSSYQDTYEHVSGNPSKSYKSDRRFIKDLSGPRSQSGYNSYHLSKGSDFHKPHNVWKRSTGDYHVGVNEDNFDPSEDLVIPLKSEPPENTEEFKQLVHGAFLKFSKKLNENPAVRRRYMEQGEAGCLFCIVCGRSMSKEFLDTRRLATHAYMSHKTGLRAQHLGLHKAICVLLGWNTTLVRDTITWVPEVLSSAEALTQKEDQMLWPPLVIIHNGSMSNSSNPEGQKVIKTEEVESFLRGKGFGERKIKVSLGRPSDHSVMVVKFLGTIPGLQDAESLHKYYVKNRRGRADFQQISTSYSKIQEEGDAADNMEAMLYGYLGIAEDMDKLDSETKRRCLIKSKREIQELVDDPVKPPDER